MNTPGRPSVRLQPLSRARVRALGDLGTRWEQSLPSLLTELGEEWNLSYGRSLPGGSNSYVCRATRDDEPVVIKVCLPTEELSGQVNVLRRADGRGYARLLEVDFDRRAVLMEQLGPALPSVTSSIEDQLRLMAETLHRAWQDPGIFPELDPTSGKADSLIELITGHWSRLDRPCPAAVVDRALENGEWLARRPATHPVVVHGDPHPHNALAVRPVRAGAESGYCFVDPEGFVEDPCYDLGVVMRDFSSRVLADPHPTALVEHYAAVLARHSGYDAERIRRWAFVERVSSGLYIWSFGAERVARPFLESAARIVEDTGR